MRLLLCKLDAIDPCPWGLQHSAREEGAAAWLPCHHLYRLDSFPSSLASFLPCFSSPHRAPPSHGPRAATLLAHTRFNLLLLSPAAPFSPHRFHSPPFSCPKALALGGRFQFQGFLIQSRFAVLAGEALLGVQQQEDCRRARHSWGASICAGARFDWRGVFLETHTTGAPIRRRRSTLMRLSHCESNCADPLCYIPCLPKPKDASPDALSSAAPCPVAVTEDKPPPVQKIEDDGEGGKDEKTLAAAPPPPPPQKSNLKKPNCAADGLCAPKGNVKWLDLLGKDLTEVKEFEPSESGDSMDDGDGMSGCVCVIQ